MDKFMRKAIKLSSEALESVKRVAADLQESNDLLFKSLVVTDTEMNQIVSEIEKLTNELQKLREIKLSKEAEIISNKEFIAKVERLLK